MNLTGRRHLEQAALAIRNGHAHLAVADLQLALRNCSNPRAWSKVMLALRETKRIVASWQQQQETFFETH